MNCFTEKKSKKQQVFYVCIIIFVLALSLRLFELVFNPLLSRDAALYLDLADQWYETGGFSQPVTEELIVPPLLIWSIKVLMMLFGINSEVAGRTLTLFLGAILPTIAFLFTWKACNKIRIGLVAAVLIIIHPELISYSLQPLRETPYFFFNGLLLIILAGTLKKDGIIQWGFCGLLLSLAFFSRYEALEFLLIVPLILGLLFLNKTIRIKQAIMNICSFFFSFILSCVILSFVIDYTIFLYQFADAIKKLFQ